MPLAGSIQLGYKNETWFSDNDELILLSGQPVFLENTTLYKIGDGATGLAELAFSNTFSYIIVIAPNGHRIKFTVDNTCALSQIGEDLDA